MARILLLGKGGQLGFALSQSRCFAGTEGDRLLALDRSGCDLTNPESILAAVRDAKPDIILNAAAYTAVDRAEDEPELAHAVNEQAPGILAEAAKSSGAVLVHYSTDYVFDGAKPTPYEESDPVGPIGVYGASKLAGEQAIADVNCRHIILRTSWVYGAHGQNFAKTMLRLAQERADLSVVGDQWGTPTSVDLLRDVTERIISSIGVTSGKEVPVEGLYHCTAAGRTNWRDYAAYFLTCCEEEGLSLALDPRKIAAIPTEAYPTKARRPKNSLLSCKKLEQTLTMTMPDWRVDVQDLAIGLARQVEQSK